MIITYLFIQVNVKESNIKKVFTCHTHFRSSKVIVPRGSASILFPQNFSLG